MSYVYFQMLIATPQILLLTAHHVKYHSTIHTTIICCSSFTSKQLQLLLCRFHGLFLPEIFISHCL